MRDSSDYLVNTFFAAVRKKLNRDGLRWYGIRTVEPHHDGTVHWHMMVFAHPEEIDTIVSHTRDIAIQEPSTYFCAIATRAPALVCESPRSRSASTELPARASAALSPLSPAYPKTD